MARTQKVTLKSSEFQPKQNFVLVDPEDINKEKVTESGIVLAIEKSSVDRPSMGSVIAVGPDVKDLSEGTIVLWPMTDGLDIEFLDSIKVLLKYDSIIGSKK